MIKITSITTPRTVITITPATIAIVDRYIQQRREVWKKQKHKPQKKRGKRGKSVILKTGREEENTIDVARREERQETSELR